MKQDSVINEIPLRPKTALSSATPFEQELITAVIGRILSLTSDVRNSGLDEDTLGEPTDIAARMIAAIPRSDPFNLELGPFYTALTLAKWKGVTRQYIHELTKQRRILVLTTADNRKVYPSYQFGIKGATLPHLADILDVLSENADPWAQAMWFVTRSAALNNRTPADHLKRGGDGAAAILAARQSMTIFEGAPLNEATGS